jgi:hypothetical protein
MKTVLGAIHVALILLIAAPSNAITRHRSDGAFFGRTAASGYFGVGVPVGQFSDADDGNHKAGGLDWSFELEHYFAPGVSLGFSFSAGTYEDKDFGKDLKTRLNTFGGFFKFTFENTGLVHPYVRFGLGSMEVAFDAVDENVDAERSGTMSFGGGLVLLVTDNLSVNGQTLYHYGWTDDAVIHETEEPTIVGFDVSYWSFDVGLSVYFP